MSTDLATVPDDGAEAERWSLREELGPFLDSLPGGESLLDATEDFLRADGFDAVRSALRRIFIGILGYEEAGIDQSGRIPGQKAHHRLLLLARHRGFGVSLFETDQFRHHTSKFQPAFQVQPYGVLFVFDPLHDRKLACYRSRSARPGSPLLSSVISGWAQSHPRNDSLVSWAWRLGELRPRPEDDEFALTGRAERALGRRSEEFAGEWTSAPLQDPWIGTPFHESAAREFDSFMQKGREGGDRRRWGLEAVLADSFPIRSRRGRPLVVYRGYEVTGLPIAPDTALGRGISRLIELRLLLGVTASGTEAPLEIRCALPAPAGSGRFILEGEEFLFVPEIPEPEKKGPRNPEGSRKCPDDPGCSLHALLRISVRRRLAAVRRIARRTFCREETDPDRLKAALHPGLDEQGRYPLFAQKWLIRRLERTEDLPRIPEPVRLARRPGASSKADPPAWGCPELSSALPVGLWAPVAAARLHPLGTIALPFEEDRAVRLCVPGTTLWQANPRLGGCGAGSISAWTAPGLGDFSGRPVGAVLDPLGAVSATLEPLSLVAVAVPGEEFRILAVPGALPSRPPSLQSWRVKVALDPEAESLPTPLTRAGQRLRPGDPWLGVPTGTWPSDPELHVTELLRLIRGKGRASPEKGRPLLLRLPPGFDGWVESVEIHPVHSRFGVPLFVVATIRLLVRSPEPEVLLLPDGRSAALRSLVPGDAPFRPDGTRADVLVQDPGLETTETGEWLDGATGEPLRAKTISLPLRRHRPSNRGLVTSPDIHLRVRRVDGEGLPAGPYAPSLSELERRTFAIADPMGYSRAIELARTAPGEPPEWMHVASPLLAIAAGSAKPPASGREIRVDPLRQRPRSISTTWADAPEFPPARIHACACGRIEGRERWFETCASCGEPVLPREPRFDSPAEPPAIELPAPVLHPWRTAAAAGLLGLTPGELRTFLTTEDLVHLPALLEQALEDPLRRLAKRLEREPAARPRRDLGVAALALHRELGCRDLAGRLWLRSLALLAPPVRLDGLPRGAPLVLASGLTLSYRAVNLACSQVRQLEGSGSYALATSALVGLEDAVTRLFGKVGDRRESLASRLLRAFPLTRKSDIRFSWPGLFRVRGRMVGETAGWFRREVSWLESRPTKPAVGEMLGPEDFLVSRPVFIQPGPEEEAGVWLDEGLHAIPALPSRARRPAEPAYWTERAALARILERHFLPLALLLGALDSDLTHLGIRRADLEPLPARTDPGTLAAREWAVVLTRQDSRPSLLLPLLEGPLPLSLPDDGKKARSTLEDRLATAFPASDEGAAFLRRAFALLFGGWSRCRPDLEHPTGWRRVPKDEDRVGDRRAPPLHSSAWLVFPGFEALAQPTEWLLRGEQAFRELPPVALRLLGFPAGSPASLPELARAPEPVPGPLAPAVVGAEPREPDDWTEAPREEPAGAVDPCDGPPPEVSVLRYTIGQWLTAGDGRRE